MFLGRQRRDVSPEETGDPDSRDVHRATLEIAHKIFTFQTAFPQGTLLLLLMSPTYPFQPNDHPFLTRSITDKISFHLLPFTFFFFNFFYHLCFCLLPLSINLTTFQFISFRIPNFSKSLEQKNIQKETNH